MEQRVNEKGEVIGVQVPTLLELNPYTGRMTDLSTFAGGDLPDRGNLGGATTSFEYFQDSGLLKSKSYAGEASPSWQYTYEKEKVKTVTRPGGITGIPCLRRERRLGHAHVQHRAELRRAIARWAGGGHEPFTHLQQPNQNLRYEYNAERQLVMETLPQWGGGFEVTRNYYPRDTTAAAGSPRLRGYWRPL